MFHPCRGSYAGGMERNAPVTNLLQLAPRSAARQPVARICGTFALRCLKTIGKVYVESALYHPYWIGAGAVSTPRIGGATRP